MLRTSRAWLLVRLLSATIVENLINRIASVSLQLTRSNFDEPYGFTFRKSDRRIKGSNLQLASVPPFLVAGSPALDALFPDNGRIYAGTSVYLTAVDGVSGADHAAIVAALAAGQSHSVGLSIQMGKRRATKRSKKNAAPLFDGEADEGLGEAAAPEVIGETTLIRQTRARKTSDILKRAPHVTATDKTKTTGMRSITIRKNSKSMKRAPPATDIEETDADVSPNDRAVADILSDFGATPVVAAVKGPAGKRSRPRMATTPAAKPAAKKAKISKKAARVIKDADAADTDAEAAPSSKKKASTQEAKKAAAKTPAVSEKTGKGAAAAAAASTPVADHAASLGRKKAKVQKPKAAKAKITKAAKKAAKQPKKDKKSKKVPATHSVTNVFEL